MDSNPDPTYKNQLNSITFSSQQLCPQTLSFSIENCTPSLAMPTPIEQGMAVVVMVAVMVVV
eukprot:3357688-Karenia_brevis.AAC.1